MASKVGPAVTRTRLPGNNLGWKKAQTCSTISAGSSILPAPVSPQAWIPLAGPSIVLPSLIKRCTLLWVAWCSHICKFIAGTNSKGQLRAKHKVVSKSSARPSESLASKSAVAGATRIASAVRESSIWAILLSMRASHWLVKTGNPVRACMVTGVINCCAAALITTCTVAPSCINKRANSADL